MSASDGGLLSGDGLVGGILPGDGLVGGLLEGLTTRGGLGDSLWGDDDSGQGTGAVVDGRWDGARDQGSLFSLTKRIGAHDAWRRGVTGRGVTVALIDTGVAPVPGLDDPDQVVDGPDLSYESQRPGTRYLDGFGHGTHMAGIIAGRDARFDPRRPSPETFAGVAPDAELLSLKVATGDGGADVSQVIAAIDWVVRYRRAQGMNVRVLNLSYGTASTQSWQVDPLAAAVENAWDKGILVVVSGGNDGPGHPLLMPAIDPHVLAVGAADHEGTALGLDDSVASFSNSGTRARRPDVLAPGKSVVSLRVPGSFADQLHPEGRVPGDHAERYFRGSGTSQAAAATSGAAALLFQARPDLTPAQAKAILMRTAQPLLGLDPAQGDGMVAIDDAVSFARSARSLPSAAEPRQDSSGRGTLEATRAGEHIVDPATGDALVGEFDALGSPWKAKAWMAAQAQGKSWKRGRWNGRVWTGRTWVDKQLQAVPWTGLSWNGVPWKSYAFSEDQWEARSWRGDNWEARSWRARSWRARSWRGVE
ncbi:S8 family serine peptidase [Nocardioides coralli]|uniref:S8 family serine peptidase n=1 Tax=Nocardioides coralli TaxID=2872154 RepID=UPI001CA4377F|nr:S8 family serine peptidase [Nocardioides coralli]QZY28431.1 S8 family serine peptidase [Nocardioides coralli]